MRSGEFPARGNIILVGFMGAGKTSVGKVLSQRLGRPFTDLDEEIVSRTGLDIPGIFESLGEPFFRRLERDLLTEICRSGERIIAAGSGAICDDRNLEVMRESGTIICLTAPEEEILRRLGGDGSRTLRDLIESRRAPYGEADFTVETSGRNPEEVADEIMKLLHFPGGTQTG